MASAACWNFSCAWGGLAERGAAAKKRKNIQMTMHVKIFELRQQLGFFAIEKQSDDSWVIAISNSSLSEREEKEAGVPTYGASGQHAGILSRCSELVAQGQLNFPGRINRAEYCSEGSVIWSGIRPAEYVAVKRVHDVGFQYETLRLGEVQSFYYREILVDVSLAASLASDTRNISKRISTRCNQVRRIWIEECGAVEVSGHSHRRSKGSIRMGDTAHVRSNSSRYGIER